MANEPSGVGGRIDRRTVLRAGAAHAAAGPLLRAEHSAAQTKPKTVIDSQVHAYAANTPERPWARVPNWPAHVTGGDGQGRRRWRDLHFPLFNVPIRRQPCRKRAKGPS